ncbi:MAG TPA: ribosomal protein S18-alanine N-acetyltransferase [Terriglobales bacterium]|nr:ribosomal protein S18-alanine N-acetyltransferase [Terriglobales bacterium]
MTRAAAGEARFFIRRMREADLGEVRSIETLSFSNPWSEDTFRGEIQNSPVSFPMVVVEKPGDRVIGYIIFWHIREDVQVNNIAVHPDFRGRGIAEALMRHVIDKVRANGATFMTLEVRVSNAPAVTLYRKLGFEVLGTRKNYYTHPDEDAYMMGLVLDQ